MISQNNCHRILQIKGKKTIKKPQKTKEFYSKKIENDKLKDAEIKILYTPPKIIGFNFSYKIPGDIYIDDHAPPKEIFASLICKLKFFKKISCVFHDRERKLIGCNLSDIYKNEPPIELLITRLKTVGDIDAYHLSLTIEKVVNVMNQFGKLQFANKNEPIFEKESYKLFLKKTNTLIKKLSSQGPLLICNGSNFENFLLHPLTQLSFNYKFIRLIGEDIESFPLQLLKKGIPECVLIDQDYFKIINKITNQCFFLELLDEKIECLIKSKYKNLRATTTSYIMKFNEGNYNEIYLIQMFEINKNDMQWIKLNNFENNKKNEITKNIQNGKNITSLNHFNLILENNCFKMEERSMIKRYYPNLHLNYSEYEPSEKLRCGMKTI